MIILMIAEISTAPAAMSLITFTSGCHSSLHQMLHSFSMQVFSASVIQTILMAIRMAIHLP